MTRKTKTKPTRNERLRNRLKAIQKDPDAGSITLRIRLTGALVDVWRSLRDAAEGTRLSDSDVLGMLLIAGSRQVRQSIRILEKGAQHESL